MRGQMKETADKVIVGMYHLDTSDTDAYVKHVEELCDRNENFPLIFPSSAANVSY